MKRQRHAFRERAAHEALALDERLFDPARPSAFGFFFDVPPPLEFDPDEVDEGVAVLRLSGPIEHHRSWLWHSYEDLVAEIERAQQSAEVEKTIVRIDSPGGVCAGMGECHKAIRAMRARYGKPIYAFADELAASAAYHVASACDELWLPEAAEVGSVGVILCTIDETAALEKAGVAVRYLVSGARKADLHPGQPVTDEVVKVAQAKVDHLAELFFRAVARARGLTPAAVKGLEAGVFFGPAAVEVGLADGVAGWAKFLSYVKGAIGGTVAPSSATGTERADASHEATMPKKILQLQQALDEATAAVATARKAVARAPESKKALAGLEEALAEKLAARAALDAAQGKTTTTRHVKHEEKTVEREEDEDPDEEDEEDEDEEAAAERDEDEEATAAAASAWKAADKAYRKAIRGHAAEATLELQSPERLRRACREATGQESVRAMFGALEGYGQRIRALEKTEQRLGTLERESKASKVDKLIIEARAAGKLVGKAHVEDMRAQGVEHGPEWLKGRLASMPKLVRTEVDGELLPRMDGQGNALGAPTGVDQQRMAELASAGLSPEEKKRFEADVEARLKKANGATPTF